MTRDWNGSAVMGEFARIAAESGLVSTDFGDPAVGNPDKSPVGPFRNNPGVSGKTDTLSVDSNSKDYGVTKGMGEDLVGKAHPKDAEPAEAMGKGGLVEDIVQQQEADIGVATRMPSGALIGRHAALVAALVDLANGLEGEGKAEAAARIDGTIGRISDIPFGDGLRKEAVGPLAALLLAPLKWVMWGGAAAGVGAAAPGWLSKLTSTKEDLATDIQDVLDKAASARDGDPSLSSAEGRLRALLAPHAAAFRKPLPAPGDEAALGAFLGNLQEFSERVIPDARELVAMMVAVRGGLLERIGLGAKSRLKEAFGDMVSTFRDTMGAVAAAAKIGRRLAPKPEAAKPEVAEPGVAGPEVAKPEAPARKYVAEIQSLLAEQGLEVPRTGRLDGATMDALRQMERRLDADLRRDPGMAEILERRGWSVVGALLRADGTVGSPSALRRLLSLAEIAKAKSAQGLGILPEAA
jgi:hypothetical protein